MALPAYDQCIKASHVFNLLDARGVISVTERQSYIMRVRELAKACGEAWVHTEAGGAGCGSRFRGEAQVRQFACEVRQRAVGRRPAPVFAERSASGAGKVLHLKAPRRTPRCHVA